MKDHAALFLKAFESLTSDFNFSSEDRQALELIAKNHLLDLTTNTQGYYDEQLLQQLTQLAAEHLVSRLQAQGNVFSSSLWQDVVTDYHRNGYWGIQKLSAPPVHNESHQTPAREMFKYIWIFIQAGILMKAVVLYFGLNAANEESSTNTLFLYLALGFSFLSMSFFAWRLHRKEQANSTEPK